jgi:eukaryotic-like serine/threonine-protein kinase
LNGSDPPGGGSGELSSSVDSLLREAARAPKITPKVADIDRVGSTIGSFVIRAELGRGGMGIVYLAEDTRLGRDIALKILPAAFVDEDRRRRFLREAHAAARVSHPNVVSVFEVGQIAGNTFIAMEYVEGRTLRALLEESGGAPLPLREALAITRAIADGLESAHVAGIVHRDLKPENVMITRRGLVKILDFGLAKVAALSEHGDEGTAANAGQLTAKGQILGTPSYMSPEQVTGRSLDLRSDLFSLGVMLYEMVTGARPFRGSTVMEVLIAIDRDEPEPVSKWSAAAQPALERLLRRCLAKRPEDRCEGAFEIRAAIDRLLVKDPTRALETLSRPDALPAGDAAFGASRETFTRDERALVAVVLIGAAAAGTTAPEEAERIAEELCREAERRGGRADTLSEGTVVAMFSDRAIATDQATCAARSALALRRAAPTLPMALAMGRTEGAGKRPDELIDRAKGMLAKRAAHPGNPIETAIALDEMTAGLLGAAFDVRRGEDGPRLAGEVPIPDMARTLLGRPTPCVGRDRELATLARLFDECVEEPLGRAVLVVAPAGVGKSRLMREMLRIVRRQRGDGVAVWIGPGDPLCVDSAFGILGHALADECGILGGEPLASRRAKVEARVAQTVAEGDRRRIAEFLGELIGAPFSDDESPQLRAARKDAELMNEQMRRAFLDFVAGETSRRPLLLVLEDLHWSDVPTVRFVDAALRAHGDKPFMVLALARPEIFDRFPKLWAGRDLHQIHLKELSRKAAGELARHVLDRSVNDSIVDRVVDLADGNAFYLEELIRAAARGESEALPATVIALVQARLREVDGDSRRLLRAASVFGEVFWQSAVEGLAGGATDGLLSELVEREIIVRHLSSRFPDERQYAFRHALLREGAYSSLTEADLVLGHRLAAEWLEQRGERDSMVLAEHFERGGLPLRAAGFYADAAAQALNAGDIDAAITCAERGLACDPKRDVREQLLAVLCDARARRSPSAPRIHVEER